MARKARGGPPRRKVKKAHRNAGGRRKNARVAERNGTSIPATLTRKRTSRPALDTQGSESAEAAAAIPVTTELLPLGRAVRGRDLRLPRQLFGWDQNTTDAAFGMPRRSTWYEITSTRGEEPVKDEAHAVLLRLYLEIPECRPAQDTDAFGYLANAEIELVEIAVIAGRNFKAAYHWGNRKLLPRPVLLIVQALKRAGVTHRSHPVFERVMSFARAEHEARGRTFPDELRKKSRPREPAPAEGVLLTPVDD